MGVYWKAASYKRDSSYISGEIKSRGLYEFNIEKIQAFETREQVQFRHGVQLFHDIMNSSNCYEIYGIYDKERALSFYFLSDDMIDGTTIRRNLTERFGLLFEPQKPLEVLITLFRHTNNLESIVMDDKNEMYSLMNLLDNAVKNNYLVHFSWIE
jgi:hypothetical protein